MDLQPIVRLKKSNKVRKERAARMEADRKQEADMDSTGEEDPVGGGVKRPPRKKIKEKEVLSEALYEEDIIEGFSFVAFKTYDDCEVGLSNVLNLYKQLCYTITLFVLELRSRGNKSETMAASSVARVMATSF